MFTSVTVYSTASVYLKCAVGKFSFFALLAENFSSVNKRSALYNRMPAISSENIVFNKKEIPKKTTWQAQLQQTCKRKL